MTSYTDNLHLFDTAFQARGRIDHAVSVAGLGEQGNIVDPLLTLESVREEPRKSLSVLDVNLRGPIFFARIASVYLRQPGLSDKSSTVAADKSLTLVSSVAGFKESPGLFVYQSAKHGVLGLMRSLRKYALLRPSPIPSLTSLSCRVLINATPQPIRTNAICPWMTRTRLVSGIEKAWDEAGLPSNSPEDVARIIVGALADDELNGEALYIEGGRAWAIEKNISDLQHVWLGQKQHDDLMRGQEVLGSGAGWLDSHQEK